MASIKELYDKSAFAKYADASKDKTPISADKKNKLHLDDASLAEARRGKLNQTNYSDTVTN